MNGIKKKDLEYFELDAQRQHRAFLRQMVRAERVAKGAGMTYKGRHVCPQEVRQNMEANARKTIVTLLMETFKVWDNKELRLGMWNEVKYQLRAACMEISLTDLKRMRRMWLEKESLDENSAA